MDRLKIFCMCLENSNLEIIKNLNYLPVGLKNDNFSDDWLRDNTLDNISIKNPFYGEYTFYYWYWKNLLKEKEKDEWVGFCSYREYWSNKNFMNKNQKNLKNKVLQEVPKEWNDYDTIVGEPIHIDGSIKFSKVIKYGKLAFLRNPMAIFRSKRTIRWQFDMFHGNGNLDKAIELLPDKDRNDFKLFVRSKTSFSRGNMFITKSDKIIDKYFQEIFEWLEKCEKIFGFNLKGYGQIRMYTFLAERFLPYWFKKYTKSLEWPVIYCDINK
jgi:hypothetical protein